MAIYGHFGKPILAYPTAAEGFEEFERQGMVGALAELIHAGAIKLITIDSINSRSWSNSQVGVTEAAALHQAYDTYVVEEVLPRVYDDCGGPLSLGVMGASFGAYHAINTLLRHPDLFDVGYGLSGVYDISEYFEDKFDHNCYQNSPRHYLPDLKGTPRWSQLEQVQLNLICGQGAWERVHWTTGFSEFLNSVGFEHNLDLWGHDVAHDWDWWFKQMNHYLRKVDT